MAEGISDINFYLKLAKLKVKNPKQYEAYMKAYEEVTVDISRAGFRAMEALKGDMMAAVQKMHKEFEENGRK